jgi:type I restriction enzyme S subunit
MMFRNLETILNKMGNFGKYPAYKDSGVGWLGEIPAGWDVKRIKSLSRVKRGASPRPIDNPKYFDDNGEFAWVRIADVSANEHFLVNTTQRLSKLGASLSVKIMPNELMLSIAGTVGKPMISNIKCCIHDGFVYFPDLKKSIAYIYRIFETGTPYAGLGKFGTQLNLNTETVGNISIPFPPLPEQTAIAAFLDEKTVKIDTAIAQKEKMISLLKERKQILIQNAVTKGINPDAKMKDSGVEWIGEIPEGWEVKRFKHLHSNSFGGGTPSTDKEHFWNGDIPWISSADVKQTLITKTLRNISAEGLARSSANVAPSGSIIIVTRSGILQHTLPIAIIAMDMAINQDIKCFILKKDLLPKYLLNFINGKNKEILIETRQQGATVESINLELFANLQITIPSINEQQEIADFIETQSAKIDTTISIQQQQIAKLKEYKSILIDSAVTGKIKVC